MSHSHQHTNFHDHTPYHKLTEAQARAWCLPPPFGLEVRRKMASQLSKMYPAGCGVCSPTMKLVAYVQPDGNLRLLMAPFKVIPISAIANKPKETDCPCLQFWDPEVKGPWKNRSEGERQRFGGHHPMCQYQRDADKVFAELYQAKNGGVDLDHKGKAIRTGKKQRVRPDLMLRVQNQIRGR